MSAAWDGVDSEGEGVEGASASGGPGIGGEQGEVGVEPFLCTCQKKE
jgi:hypothetical protein